MTTDLKPLCDFCIIEGSLYTIMQPAETQGPTGPLASYVCPADHRRSYQQHRGYVSHTLDGSLDGSVEAKYQKCSCSCAMYIVEAKSKQIETWRFACACCGAIS